MKNFIHPELNKALIPIKRRFYIKSLIHMAVVGFLAALFQGVIWLIISFFIPIFNLEVKASLLGGIIFIISCIIGLIRRPSIYKIAREIDNMGLQERVMTALELSNRNDHFACLQRQDTIEELKSFDPKSVAINMPKNKWIAAAGLGFLLIILLLIPNPQDEIIYRQLQLEKSINEQVEELEQKANEELSDSSELTEEEKRELKKLLKELAQKLKESRDYREAIKEVTKTEEKVEKLLKEAHETKVARLGEELSKYQVTNSLGQKVKAMDKQGIIEEMERLKEIVRREDMDSRESLAELQQALENAANQTEDKDLKTSIQETADAIASDLSLNGQSSIQALEDLEVQLTQMVQSPNNLQDIVYMLQTMKGNIAQNAGQDISNLAWASDGQQADNNGGDNKGGQDSSGGSSQNGSGQEGGSNSRGSGTGNSNTTAGDGTGTGSGPQGKGLGGAQGSGIGSGHTEYEKIYDPKRLEKESDTSQVTGSLGSEGSSEQVNAGQGMGSLDGFIPYNEVFGEYKNQAMERLDRIDIPYNMRELVKNYFNSLED